MAEPGPSEEMEDGPTFRSTGGSSKDTVAGGTESFGSEQKRKAHSSHLHRLQKLKAHHDSCENRYEKANTKRLNDERERTLFLIDKLNTMKVPKYDSDGDSTVILDLTTADDEKDASVPLLTRTDSVMLKREMLGYTAEESLSSSDVSEDEYVPESVGETESDSPAEEVKQHKGKKRKVQKTNSANCQGADVQPRKTRRMAPSCSLAANDEESPSAESSDVTVKTLKKKQNGNRLYDKKFYCMFCSKPFSKMARHLESKHKDKPEVARAIIFPKGSKERRIQLGLLRNKGNRAHNNQVLKQGTGMVIPCQQSSAPVKVKDYMHCINCEGYLKRKSLWRHMQRCHLNKKVKGLKPGKTRVQTICAYAQPVPDSVSAQFWKLVLNMHEDNVRDVVRKERSILKFGEHLFNKHGHDVTKHEYVRQKMRETGRLLIQGQENGKLKTMSDFFVPANFPHVIDAVKNVAGLNEETNAYKTPSLALKLGHNLKKIASIVECEAIITGDENTTNNVRAFKQICDTKWNECVSSQALRNLCEAKWNVPQLLPFAEDVRKMHQFLSVQRIECRRKLEEEPSKKPWAELAKITLCEVILFNRRREGEVSKMSLSAFTLRDTSLTHPDVELALSDLEKKLCKHFERIEIRGKRDRKVPILLTPDMLASMELLVKTRQICDVSDDNQFMFGRPQALTYFRGSDVIRWVARSCGANHPEALSSTKLRKHMATMSKVLNLKDNEMDDLADFLGHDIRVHRQYYRLPEGTLQLAKISKVLMALERGQLAEFKGRNLDEINIDPEEKVVVDSETSDAEDEDAALSSSQSSGRSDENMPLVREVSDEAHTTKVASGVVKKSTADGIRENDLHPAQGRSDENMPLVREVSDEAHTTKGSSKSKKRKWGDEEIRAVERTLLDYIRSWKVPGKAECLKCIETSPLALRGRSWEGVKFYVKNRIDALRRESVKKR